MTADQELLGPALLQLDSLVWACSWHRAQIGFRGFSRTASVGERTRLSLLPFRCGLGCRSQIECVAIKECGPIEGQRRRGSLGRPAGLDGRTVAIAGPAVMFEERLGIVDVVAGER